jgi:hypothetical protein
MADPHAQTRADLLVRVKATAQSARNSMVRARNKDDFPAEFPIMREALNHIDYLLEQYKQLLPPDDP